MVLSGPQPNIIVHGFFHSSALVTPKLVLINFSQWARRNAGFPRGLFNTIHYLRSTAGSSFIEQITFLIFRLLTPKRMKRIIYALLFLTIAFPCFSQFKHLAESAAFEEPEAGFAKLLQMKNGNTIY